MYTYTRVQLYDCLSVRKLLLIRPKLNVCDDGNYRETRWFISWKKKRHIEDHYLPRMITNITEQSVVAFGDAVISTRDTCIGFEICEELWNPASSHVDMGLDGVEIVSNGSGSYHQLRKTYVTVDLVKSATMKSGGCYLFNNLRGCDGQRVYFSGCSCIAINGDIISRTKEFALEEVEVMSAVIDLEDIRQYRNSIRSRCSTASESPAYPRVTVDFSLSIDDDLYLPCYTPIEWKYHTPEEEIALGPACWLWDYLRYYSTLYTVHCTTCLNSLMSHVSCCCCCRRSRQGGYFLPLSGGVDSSSTACVVYSMCRLVVNAVRTGGV
jgi:NAD+ synthase (glutamine-hydrolysing)